ncbi:RNA 2'-phosphotransferase [Herpetosiphon geysericola]|uniref:Probable RNA 2'-phosphotransferase n=1 Tax=Herpetosiphon geysericola TaxID=70996 RepID=A0A0P6YR54_9CHLR|nr:RNA 2'-phosphotransferase [Herpetosiphon geysericola]KPL85653.1 RNA 2'-phosphotransferase [Herpetosiphon geysericola]
MDERRFVRVSKYLSKHLRHQPERLGLSLEHGGWVAVDALLAACEANNFAITKAELEQVVAHNNKQRFGFDQTGQKIRAHQGHTVTVDLGLEPQQPPAMLYHGTAKHNLATILQTGLRPMQRQHVHLSLDRATALKVGARHGQAVLLIVKAEELFNAGQAFFCSDNGVWLTTAIDPAYLELASEAR